MSVSITIKKERNEEVLKSFYHDAFIHTMDECIFEVHKVILASCSPFFHKFFQSRPGNDVNDVLFLSIPSCIIKPALDLIYHEKVLMESKHEKRFIWFIQTMLGMKLATEDEKI